MILSAHTVTGFLNKSKDRSRAGAHVFLSEKYPKPKLNVPVSTIAKIIKSVMASEAEAEMAALYIAAKNMIPLRNTLIEMGWPQLKLPIQIYNSTSVGFINKTIVNKALPNQRI